MFSLATVYRMVSSSASHTLPAAAWQARCENLGARFHQTGRCSLSLGERPNERPEGEIDTKVRRELKDLCKVGLQVTFSSSTQRISKAVSSFLAV